MTVIKRNQLIVLALAIMIIAAGYLNFTYQGSTDPYAQELTGSIGDRLGEATLVEQGDDSIQVGYAEPVSNNLNSPITDKKDSDAVANQNDTVMQSSSMEQFFSETRLEKERTRDQEISLHEQVLSNSSASKDAQEKAQDQLTAISQKWEKEMIIERLIKSKGFKDAVVFINEGSVNVVVLSGGSLKPAQVAQIQDIVMREAKVSADNIKIVPK